MIFQIAAGVCMGIVAAVVILKNWQKILAAVGGTISWLAIVALLVAMGGGIWAVAKNISWQKVLIIAGSFVLVAVLYGVPFIIYGKVIKKYPALETLVRGEPPWNQLKRLPVRLLVMTGVALSVAVIGVGGMLGLVWVLGSVGILN